MALPGILNVTIRKNTIADETSVQMARMRTATREGLRQEGRLGQRRIRSHTPRRTGEAARSVLFELVSSGMREGVRWFTTLARFIFIEDGTRPHLIVPRNARALRFTIGGRVIFTKRVNHPGTRAYRPFFKGTQVYRSGRAPLLRRRLEQVTGKTTGT